MKAFRYFIISVSFVSVLIGNIYAYTPAVLQSGIKTFFKTVYFIVMFALILAAAYYVTKFLARKGMVQGKAKTIKVLETIPLGVDKSLHLIKVGSQFFLIGSASKNMFMISELEKDKLFEGQENEAFNLDEIESYEDSVNIRDFNTYLNTAKKSLHKLKSMVRGSNDNE